MPPTSSEISRRAFLAGSVLAGIGGMTIARRLLMGGGGSFTLPTILDLTTSPDGAWSSPAFPKFVGYNGYTYLGWINTSNGDVKMAAAEDATAIVSAQVVHAALNADNHASPSIMVRDSDHHLLIGYSAHDGSHALLRISVNSLDSDPTISGGFASEQSLLTAGDYTYVSLVQAAGVTGQPIYLIYRNITTGQHGQLRYVKSTGDGEPGTWSAAFAQYEGVGDHTPYWRVVTDWDRYIHVLTTDIEPGLSNNVGHFYLDATDDTVYQSDGTQITASAPFTFSDITLVQAGTLGTLAVQAACVDGTGKPAVALEQQIGGTDLSCLNVRWDGAAWVAVEVTQTTYFAANHFLPTLGLSPTNPDDMIVPKLDGSFYEIHRYQSPDAGATWVDHVITSGSSVDQFWAEYVSTPGLILAAWQSGTYVSDTNEATGIRALRTP